MILKKNMLADNIGNIDEEVASSMIEYYIQILGCRHFVFNNCNDISMQFVKIIQSLKRYHWGVRTIFANVGNENIENSEVKARLRKFDIVWLEPERNHRVLASRLVEGILVDENFIYCL